MSRIYHYRIGAIVRAGNKYLLVRAINQDGTPASGFHVPGRPLNEFKPEKVLRRFFLDYYDAEVDVKNSLAPVEKDGDSLSAYYVEEITTLRFPSDSFQFGFYSPSELSGMNVEPADRIAVAKADCFLPLLMGKKRVTPLTPAEIDKVNRMLDCLRYFSSTIPSRERKQFLALANSEIDYAGLLKAFKFVLAQYEVSYFRYLDRKNKENPFDI